MEQGSVGRGPLASRRPLREREILTLISEQFAIPMDLFAEFLGMTRKEAKDLAERFQDAGWVTVKRFFASGQPWVWLEPAGGRRCGTPFSVQQPKEFFLSHHRAVCEARLTLEREYPDGKWICERLLWQHRQEKLHAPDALYEVRNAEGEVKQWAIEVERTAKTRKEYRLIIAQRCGRYDRVLYYCTPKVAAKLTRMAEFSHMKVMVMNSIAERTEMEWKVSAASRPHGPARETMLPWEARLVRLITEQTAIPIDQFARFIGRDLNYARRAAMHLEKAGFVCRALGPVDEGFWLWATAPAIRMAEAGLKFAVPATVTLPELRCLNEARLFAQKRSPDGRWWSKRMLRRGVVGASGPAGVMSCDDREYVVEIEPNSRDRDKLTRKYERRYAEQRRYNRQIFVLCAPGNAPLMRDLKRRCGWADLFVEECAAFGPPRKRSSPKRAKQVAGRARATGSRGRPAKQSQPRPGAPKRRGGRAKKRWPLDPPGVMFEIDPDELPEEALDAIQEAAGSPIRPTVFSVWKRSGKGALRFRVETDMDTWRVSLIHTDYHASLSN